jgi:hypothetical protein
MSDRSHRNRIGSLIPLEAAPALIPLEAAPALEAAPTLTSSVIDRTGTASVHLYRLERHLPLHPSGNLEPPTVIDGAVRNASVTGAIEEIISGG